MTLRLVASTRLPGLALGLGLSAVCLWWLTRTVDVAGVAGAIAAADLALLVLATFVGLLVLGLKALRAHALYPPEDAPGRLGMLRAILFGQMLNVVAPLRVGEVGRLSLLRQADGVPLVASLANVAVEKAIDTAALAGLTLLAAGVVGLPYVLSIHGARLTAFVTVAGAVVALVLVGRRLRVLWPPRTSPSAGSVADQPWLGGRVAHPLARGGPHPDPLPEDSPGEVSAGVGCSATKVASYLDEARLRGLTQSAQADFVTVARDFSRRAPLTPAPLSARLAEARRQAQRSLSHLARRDGWWRIACWTIGAWVGSYVVNLLVLLAFHVPVPIAAPALVILVAVYAGGIVPATVGRLGVFHALVVAALVPFGVPYADALAVAVGLHLVALVGPAVIGLLGWLTWLIGARPALAVGEPVRPPQVSLDRT
ncbi:MAG: flippase-like domain-containing protein [Chloroflexi bacterium]|nr:flippase-like domain-containing protein [Chloroflexota bacterium]